MTPEEMKEVSKIWDKIWNAPPTEKEKKLERDLSEVDFETMYRPFTI